MDSQKVKLSMKEALGLFLKGKDYEIYRPYEGNNSTSDDFKDKVYKINYYLFVLAVIGSFFFSVILAFLLVSFLWYKPLCHLIHLKNRVKRYNITHYAISRGLNQ